MFSKITKNNWLFFAIKNYNIPNLDSEKEFYEDVKRFKYLKRLFRKYKMTGELKPRLILNHIIVLQNVFGIDAACTLLFFKIEKEFWGLLKTIGSVGNVIGGLGIDDTNVAGFFNSLKDGLTAPLEGMSVAFSSSLLGLAGSLILGFVDLQLGQAQNKFSQFAEKIILWNSSPDFSQASTSLDGATLNSIQKIYDNLDSLVFSLKESSNNQNQIFTYMQSLTKQIRELTNHSRDQEKKLSSFLSTQLNVQTSILQLTTELSKKGIVDSETKKILKNIDKGIHLLKSSSKRK